MRLTLMLVCLATLLVVMLAAPIACRPGLPNGHLTAHGFGKRNRWSTMYARNTPLEVDRPRLSRDMEPVYSVYGMPFPDPDSDADSY